VKNLIVNADDLGWTEGVNRGIAEAHRHGIVTSASLLANGSAFASGVEVARSTPGLGVGVKCKKNSKKKQREKRKKLIMKRKYVKMKTVIR